MPSTPPPAADGANPAAGDLVADRLTVVAIGMGAVFFACVVFGALRFVVHLTSGRATPYAFNATGALAIAIIYLWWRRDPARRSPWAVHGTAAVATVALLAPAAYGMTSSKWWLSLVGFSVLLMGRRDEAVVWSVVTLVLMPLTALVEPRLVVANAAGEPPSERAAAAFVFGVLLLGVTWMFRRAAHRRARELSETAASLERANRVKTRFLAHMSHDLRTPLHGVIALTDLARTSEAPAAVQDQVAVAQQSAQTLLSLLNNILDVTRAESDALELDPRPFHLHEALSQWLAPLAAQARARGLAFEARSDADVVEARVGDRTRLGQIVMNLVGNALKFTDQGRVELTLARGSGGDDEDVAIAVFDTGRGIGEEARDRIFEAFQQASPRDSRVQGGAGLGLAIVRELARCMGGGVAVDSRLGEGSTFRVRLRLPVAKGATARGPVDLLAARSSAAPPPERGGERRLRLLACEDNGINRQVLSAMLARLGHDAVVVDDGDVAWDRLLAEPFDLLLTDIEMPRLDGVALSRRIRERERHGGLPRLPIVGATAHVGEAERHRLFEAGMDAHLGKPFTLAELADVLASTAAMDGSASSSPARIAATPQGVEAIARFEPKVVADLAELPGEGGPLLVHLATRYGVQSRETIDGIRAALDRGDQAAAARLAHSLAGSAGTLGLARVAALGRAIQRGRVLPTPDVMARLDEESRAALEELLAFARSRA